ncbi:MAG: inositol monophosphatase family protein [Alkalispirochaeta sp.]
MKRTTHTPYEEYLESAISFARLGGDHTMHFFRRRIEVERKADDSPVTVADRETEQKIRAAITDRYPDHRVVGEEYGGTLGSSEWEWIVDPIDGTKSFIRGVPLYTTLVALLHRGRPVVGVIHAPAIGDTVAAAVGSGAYDQNGDTIAVSKCTTIGDAWFMTTDPHNLVDLHRDAGCALFAETAAVRTWADGYGYLLLARGDADVVIDPLMSPWDIAPLSVVIREAGGVFTALDGSIDDLGRSTLAAATPELHAAVARLFA